MIFHLSPLYNRASYNSEKDVIWILEILRESLKCNLEFQSFFVDHIGIDCLKMLFIETIPVPMRTTNVLIAIKRLLTVLQNLGDVFYC